MQLAVHVSPKAAASKVVGWREGPDGQRELEVKVRSAPEKGKATKEATQVVASFFHLPKSSVSCVRGEASRHKMFELPDTVELPKE